MQKISRVVLAYSGGLDTSVAIKWLTDELGCEVITLTVDVGQEDDFEEIEQRAYKIGAVKHYTIDAKDEFAEKYISKAIKANALYEGKYPLSTALARPLIAEKLVEVARKEGADAVAHGCTSKGNDQVRFEITVKALAPDMPILAPVRMWGWTRSQEVEYARKHGIPVKEEHKRFSIDENLWGRSIEGPELDDPWYEPPEDAFFWTVDPRKAPDRPGYVEIEFENGVPVALNGERMPLAKLVATLNKIAGAHGVGRVDFIEDRVIGLKSREVYEVPAAMVLLEAHKDLERMVLTKHELRFKELVDSEWARLVYYGLWHDPLREDLDAFIDAANKYVTGKVKVKLYKGSMIVVGRQSPYSAYSPEAISYEGWFPSDAEARGFIEAWGMHTIAAWRSRHCTGA